MPDDFDDSVTGAEPETEIADELTAKPKSGTAEYQRQRRARLRGEAPAPAAKNATVHELYRTAVPPAPKSVQKKYDLDAAKMSLQLLHIAVAAKINDPTFMLSDDEAHLLCNAGAKLLDYYGIKIGGKHGAILGMTTAIGVVYGPRLVFPVIKRVLGIDLEVMLKRDAA